MGVLVLAGVKHEVLVSRPRKTRKKRDFLTLRAREGIATSRCLCGKPSHSVGPGRTHRCRPDWQFEMSCDSAPNCLQNRETHVAWLYYRIATFRIVTGTNRGHRGSAWGLRSSLVTRFDCGRPSPCLWQLAFLVTTTTVELGGLSATWAKRHSVGALPPAVDK